MREELRPRGTKFGREGRPFATVALMSGMRQEVRQHGALAVLAARQHGVVSMRQLAELGYSNGAVSRAVRSGRLHRALQGVYSVGHAGLTSSCGNGAILSLTADAWPRYFTTRERGYGVWAESARNIPM